MGSEGLGAALGKQQEQVSSLLHGKLIPTEARRVVCAEVLRRRALSLMRAGSVGQKRGCWLVHCRGSVPSSFVLFGVGSSWVAMRWALALRGNCFTRASLEAAYGPLVGKGSTLNSNEVLLCFAVFLLSGLKALWGGLVLSQSLLPQRCHAVFLGIGNVPFTVDTIQLCA